MSTELTFEELSRLFRQLNAERLPWQIHADTHPSELFISNLLQYADDSQVYVIAPSITDHTLVVMSPKAHAVILQMFADMQPEHPPRLELRHELDRDIAQFYTWKAHQQRQEENDRKVGGKHYRGGAVNTDMS